MFVLAIDNKILSRIEKCFALSEGTSNPHEAKAALDKALKLLAKYNLTNDDIELSTIDSQMTDMRVPNKPQRYIEWLAGSIAECFSVRLHYSTHQTGVNGGSETRCRFTGKTANVALSIYAFDFLFRGLKIAKRIYRKKLADEFFERHNVKLSKMQPCVKNEIKGRVECYCLSYVRTIVNNLQENKITDHTNTLVDRYLEQELEWDLSTIKTVSVAKQKFSGYREDHESGQNDGAKVDVNTPITTTEKIRIEDQGAVKKLIALIIKHAKFGGCMLLTDVTLEVANNIKANAELAKLYKVIVVSDENKEDSSILTVKNDDNTLFIYTDNKPCDQIMTTAKDLNKLISPTLFNTL